MHSTTFLRETIDLVKSIETRFLELAARLYKIKDQQLWGEQYDSFQDFLDSAKIHPGNASILTSIHRNYVVQGGIEQEKLVGIGYSNLYEAIPLIERDGVQKTVEIARTLTRSEIKDEVREQKHGECTEHEPITLCTKCKKRIYESS